MTTELQAAATALDYVAREPSKCTWTWTDDDDDCWSTTCGHYFIVDNGKPSENSMVYCCFCGKEIEEVIHGDEWGGDDDLL